MKTLIPAMCCLLISCTVHSGPMLYPSQTGRGPTVLVISGRTGPMLYGEFAERLADAGYNTLLADGNDFPIDQPAACREKIKGIIRDHSRNLSGKAAVIGYSLGGAVALLCAASMPEAVAGIIAYYPATKYLTDQDACIDRLLVPVVVLQGEEDRYFNCCRVETIRHMRQAAVKKGRGMELIVYPQAGHGFNLGPLKNQELDADSWKKTTEALKRFLR